MQPWAESFYKSKEWKTCRAAYAKSKGNLCELCLKRGYIVPGVIVHHKVHLTPEHIRVFLPDGIKFISLEGNVDLLGDILL